MKPHGRPQSISKRKIITGLGGENGPYNDHSIGIELVNAGNEPYAAAQIAGLNALIADIR